MGKKSKESNHETSGAIKSLFSDSNPFRLKPQPEPQPPPPPAELGLASPPPSDDGTTVAVDAKKRKRDKKLENPNPTRALTPISIPKKRKKIENEEDEGENFGKKLKKRKRDEIEAEYEKRKYGEIAETEEVAVSVGEKRKAKDVVASEIAASKEEEEGFDDESKMLRTVFVGNLPLKIKKKVLMKEFEQFGEIESVRIRSVPLVDSKTPRKGAIIKGKFNEAIGRVNAYIVYSNELSAQAALALNMSVIGENHIRVDMACPPRKKLKGETPLYERKKTVFVGNLPFDVKDEELYQLLCGSDPSETNVEAVRVVRDPQTSLGKGIAYILFKTRDAANSICRRDDLKIRDRTLRVCHAKLDTTPSKRKDSVPRTDYPRKKFAATSDGRSSGKNDKPKPSAASLSYQGLRSSKSGVVKKSGLHPRPSGGQGNRGFEKPREVDKQAQKAKRPAVAARKAKMMKKRKLETGTPDDARRNKKARRQ